MTDISDVIKDAEQQKTDEEYRRKVILTFFECGKLKAIPAQRKKERICLEKIAEDFETGRIYDEKEVNEIITKYNDDYCTIRRDMISEKLMSRTGSKYMKL